MLERMCTTLWILTFIGVIMWMIKEIVVLSVK
jgi:hypothetical protein